MGILKKIFKKVDKAQKSIIKDAQHVIVKDIPKESVKVAKTVYEAHKDVIEAAQKEAGHILDEAKEQAGKIIAEANKTQKMLIALAQDEAKKKIELILDQAKEKFLDLVISITAKGSVFFKIVSFSLEYHKEKILDELKKQK
jgi:vacuolar-type H+-ATPase subunit E/Vma4